MAKSKKRADGRYARQIYLGIDAQGKRKYKTIYAATAKEADRMAAEYRSALGRGLDPFASARTVKDLLDALLNAKRAQGVGASWQRTLEIYARHLSPLWPVPAAKVRTADIQRQMNALAENGLSNKTLTEILCTIKSAFAMAIPEIVQYNPCLRVVVPAGRPSQKRGWLDVERRQWIIDTPHRARRAAMLMMFAGLRRGEATAVTWPDINLDARTILVSKSWDFVADKLKPPKTAAGKRVVHIPVILADFLRAERAADPDTLYVIHTARGARMTESAWRRLWASYMADLNIKYGYHNAMNKYATNKKEADGKPRGRLPILINTFTPQELRHTFCTLLYLAGVDVLTARDQMGHSDISVTLGIYTHLDKFFKARKMHKLDDFLSGSTDASQMQVSDTNKMA